MPRAAAVGILQIRYESRSMSVTELTLTGGERLRVEGDPQAIEALILSAARGSIMELAWMTEAGSGHRLGINPDHVLMLRGLGPAPER
jgi:hypothetical protein